MMNLQERLKSNARHTRTGTYSQATYWVNQWKILAKDAVDENAALRAQLAAVPVASILYMIDPFADGGTDAATGSAHWQKIDAWAQAEKAARRAVVP